MERHRILFAMQLGLGLIFAGLGHYFTASLRSVYPVDGFVFYAAALICFVFAWRTARQRPDAVWDALVDFMREAWRTIGHVLRGMLVSLRQALPHISMRGVVILAGTLNVIAALLALLIPALALLSWVIWASTIVVLMMYLLPRPLWRQPVRARTAAAKPSRVYVESVQMSAGRPNPIGLVAAVGLLIAGQVWFRTTGQGSAGALPIAASIDETFKLGLGSNAGAALGGMLLLVLGTSIFAIVTRHTALSDYPPLTVPELTTREQRVPWGWFVAALAGIAIWILAVKTIVDGAMGWGGVGPWLIALVLIGACWWQVDRTRGVRLGVHVDRNEAIGLAIVLIAMLIVLTFRLGEVPGSMWGDEGAFFTTARDIAHTAFTPDFFGLGTYALPMASSMYQSVWIGLFGANITAWRLGSAVAAWLAVVPLYFLVRSTLGKRVAWVSLVLYAASPYLLTYARMGYETAQGLLPVTLALALVWLAVRRDSRLYAFLAGCAAGLSFFTTASARLAILLGLAWLLWMWITRRVPRGIVWRQMIVVTMGLTVVAAPVVAYGLTRVPELYTSKQVEAAFNSFLYAHDYYPEDQLYETFGPIHVGEQQLFYAPDIYPNLIGRGVILTALSLHLPALIHENYLFSALSDPFGILYLLGLGWCLARFRRPGYAIWPAWLLIGGFVLSALSAYPPRAALMVPVAPALVALGALGLVAGIDVLSELVRGLSEPIKRYSLVCVTALIAIAGLREYFVEMPQHYPPDLENAIFWQAQQMPRDSDIILVQPQGLPDNFQPWGMRELDTGVKFHLVKQSNLGTADWNGLCPNRCRVFYTAADRETVYQYLSAMFGNQPTVEYPNADGAVQAYAFVVK